MKLYLAIVALLVVGATQDVWAQDVSASEQVFKKCFPCHDVGEGAKNKVGPKLNGLNGRHSGTVPGYNYSDANKNSDVTWNEQTFKEYIKNPRAMVPGTKMSFSGISNQKDIDNLWAYLKRFGPDGKVTEGK